MAAKSAAQPQRQTTFNNAKVVGVQTKEHHRRPIPKTYSYRYEVSADAGPAGDPLVRAGAVIIEGRYRGRGATWNMARSVVDPTTYLVKGGYVHPLEENPMAYPPRQFEDPAAKAQQLGRTPGFAAPAPKPAAPRQPAAPRPISAPAPIRRVGGVARPTSANESVYKKTG